MEALPNYYMRLYYLGELIANRELNMNIMQYGKWERFDFPLQGLAKVDRIVFSQGLELDVMKFNQKVVKSVPLVFSNEHQSMMFEILN